MVSVQCTPIGSSVGALSNATGAAGDWQSGYDPGLLKLTRRMEKPP